MAAASSRRRHPAATLIAFFAILAILVVILALSHTWTPKLGLDLKGGTTITLTASNSSGSGAVDQASLEQARAIIEQRVNSLGVGEAEVTTSGNNQIQVSVPNVAQDELVALVGQTAQLEFRRVYSVDAAEVVAQGQATELPMVPTMTNSVTFDVASTKTQTVSGKATSATGSPDGWAVAVTDSSGQALCQAKVADSAWSCDASRELTANEILTVTMTAADASTTTDTLTVIDPDASEATRLSLLEEQLAWTPSDTDTAGFNTYQCDDDERQVWDKPFYACLRSDVVGASGQGEKYLLGPRILEGNLVTKAGAGIPQNQMSWIVTLDFNSMGTALFSQATTTLSSATSPTNQFAIVLDGKVISAPSVSVPIPSGSAQITGSFNQQTAQNLANVLKYGSLPLSFETSNVDTVSPTLGGDQLTAGLIAGAIGLLLVILYALVYYRALAVVVFTSLVMAMGVTYLLVVVLGESMKFALSLPGLAGVIVAIGITADSFIIYFERVRDEAREGRSIRTAVETGWDKAKRTIVVADTVSLLSAVILFILSIGAIKGFAFTLGLTTLVDVAMIFFFTKPLMTLLVKTKFFGEGRKFSGFEAEHLGIAATRRPRPRGLTTSKEA